MLDGVPIMTPFDYRSMHCCAAQPVFSRAVHVTHTTQRCKSSTACFSSLLFSSSPSTPSIPTLSFPLSPFIPPLTLPSPVLLYPPLSSSPSLQVKMSQYPVQLRFYRGEPSIDVSRRHRHRGRGRGRSRSRHRGSDRRHIFR